MRQWLWSAIFCQIISGCYHVSGLAEDDTDTQTDGVDSSDNDAQLAADNASVGAQSDAQLDGGESDVASFLQLSFDGQDEKFDSLEFTPNCNRVPCHNSRSNDPYGAGLIIANIPDMYPYDDAGEVMEIDGQWGIVIHADTFDAQLLSGTMYPATTGGDALVEFTVPLNGVTDMSSDDFRLSFDIYIPNALAKQTPDIRFGFWSGDMAIYSANYEVLDYDQWIHIDSPVNSSDGSITWSDFSQTPKDWQFVVLAIRLILYGEEAVPGTETLFYVSNIEVYQPWQ